MAIAKNEVEKCLDDYCQERSRLAEKRQIASAGALVFLVFSMMFMGLDLVLLSIFFLMGTIISMVFFSKFEEEERVGFRELEQKLGKLQKSYTAKDKDNWEGPMGEHLS